MAKCGGFWCHSNFLVDRATRDAGDRQFSGQNQNAVPISGFELEDIDLVAVWPVIFNRAD